MKMIYEVTCSLHNEQLSFEFSEWKVIREFTKYMDLRNEEGKNRRILKENVNTVHVNSKFYRDGYLSASSFYSVSNHGLIQRQLVETLRNEVNAYTSDLAKNIKAIEHYLYATHK